MAHKKLKMLKQRVGSPARARVRAVQTTRVTGTPLQRMRRELFREQPLCVGYPKGCHGKVLVAVTQRDHVVPLWEGGEDVKANTQGLCDECHDRKTDEETKRRFGIK